jgi:hypothetical protein
MNKIQEFYERQGFILAAQVPKAAGCTSIVSMDGAHPTLVRRVLECPRLGCDVHFFVDPLADVAIDEQNMRVKVAFLEYLVVDGDIFGGLWIDLEPDASEERRAHSISWNDALSAAQERLAVDGDNSFRTETLRNLGGLPEGSWSECVAAISRDLARYNQTCEDRNEARRALAQAADGPWMWNCVLSGLGGVATEVEDALYGPKPWHDDALISATMGQLRKLFDECGVAKKLRARVDDNVSRFDPVSDKPLYSAREAMRDAGLPGWEMGKGLSSADAIRELARQRDEWRALAEASDRTVDGHVAFVEEWEARLEALGYGGERGRDESASSRLTRQIEDVLLLLVDQRDEFRALLAHVTRERDAARQAHVQLVASMDTRRVEIPWSDVEAQRDSEDQVIPSTTGSTHASRFWRHLADDLGFPQDVLDGSAAAQSDVTREQYATTALRDMSNHMIQAAAARGSGDHSVLVDIPRVVCLCGSTRFYDAFQQANYSETMAGRIVLSVGFIYPERCLLPGEAQRRDRFQGLSETHGETVGCTPAQKLALDELHKRKIDMADEVFVLNVDGYVGESTRSEVAYAIATSKPLRWLEPEAGEKWMEENSRALGRQAADFYLAGRVRVDSAHDEHTAERPQWSEPVISPDGSKVFIAPGLTCVERPPNESGMPSWTITAETKIPLPADLAERIPEGWTWEYDCGAWQARNADDVLVGYDDDGMLLALDPEGDFVLGDEVSAVIDLVRAANPHLEGAGS